MDMFPIAVIIIFLLTGLLCMALFSVKHHGISMPERTFDRSNNADNAIKNLEGSLKPYQSKDALFNDAISSSRNISISNPSSFAPRSSYVDPRIVKLKERVNFLCDQLESLKEENDLLSARLLSAESVSDEKSENLLKLQLQSLLNQYQKLEEECSRLSKENQTLNAENIALKSISSSDDNKSPPVSMHEFTALNVENFRLKRKLEDLTEKLNGQKGNIVSADDIAAPLAQKQLNFLLRSFPSLIDFLSSEYQEQKPIDFHDRDPVLNYLSDEEYNLLSVAERNQIALDRYIESRKKSKWQIGRDYELSVGYQYEQKGFNVQYLGSLLGEADLGRDLIATKDEQVFIIQCKYWSYESVIREKYIAQLFGTAECYRRDHPALCITPLFITSTRLSKEAKGFADKLGVKYAENYPFREFPRIKCNIGKGKDGLETYIYYLPMDRQYDSVIINKPGECKVFRVQEAEDYGFRRAYQL